LSDLDYNFCVHELSITESILNTAIKYAQKEKAHKVTDINLVIGDLSSIVDDSVQFYWEIISKGTICENSILHFHRIPATVLCQDCQINYQLEHDLTPCPKCSGTNIKILSGDDFKMDSIEIQ
jgi:hydrogenase nickel incorporation protein HypA/HybF